DVLKPALSQPRQSGMELRTTEHEDQGMDVRAVEVPSEPLIMEPETAAQQDLSSLKGIEGLVQRLKSRYVGERKQAEAELHALGPGAVELLVALTKLLQGRYLNRRRV